MGAERSIYSENKMQSHVEDIEACVIVLSNGFSLKLEKTFYVPSFFRNLISELSKMVISIYFINLKLSVMVHMVFSFLIYKDVTHKIMHVQVGIKRCVMNENSSTLWQRRLGHISI